MSRFCEYGAFFSSLAGLEVSCMFYTRKQEYIRGESIELRYVPRKTPLGKERDICVIIIWILSRFFVVYYQNYAHVLNNLMCQTSKVTLLSQQCCT